MADYDTSIRVTTKVDNSGLEDTERSIDDIKGRLEDAKKKAEALEEAGAVDTQAYQEAKKDIEKWNEALDKNIAKQKEVAKAVSETPKTGVPQTKGDFSSLSDTVEDYETRLKGLRDQGLGFGDKEYDDLYVAWKNASDAEKEYAANLNKLTDKAIADEEAKVSREKEKQAEILRKQEAEEQKLQSIRMNAEVSNQNLVDLLEEQSKLEARKAELKKAGVTDGYKEYDDINARLTKIKQEVDHQKNGFKNLGDSAKKAFKKVNDGAKKSGGLLGTFTSRLKGIALSLLVFNWITKAFNAMVAGMKEGFNNLVQYSDEYNDAMSQLKSAGTQLKNSLATAFAPIITTAIPYLVQLIGYMTSAANKVAEFVAIMSGASSWTKAVAVQEDYAASLNGTASSAKKAAGALASFDTINVLSKSDSDSGTTTTAPKDMFEEVAVDNNKVKAFDELKKSAQELMDLFALGFGDGLGDFDSQIENIRDNLRSIGNSLLEIFTDSDVVAAAQEALGKMAVAAGQMTGAFISVGATIAQNLTGGLAIYLEENSDYLKEKLISIFNIAGDIAVIVGEASVAFANIFSAFGDENGQLLTANLIGIFVNSFFELTELLGELARDILDVITRPFIDNQDSLRAALDGFLGTAATVMGTFKDAVDDTFAKVDEVYQQYFKPFFDSVAQGLSDLTAHFLEFWNGSVQPLLDTWAAEFDALWKESIQPMIDNFIVMLGQIAEMLMIFWEEVLVPLIDWIINNVLPVILPILDGIVEAFWAVVEGITEAVNGIIQIIGGITEFLVGVFTGDWQKAWNGIVKIFEGIQTTIKGIINGILGAIEALANGVVDGINMVIQAMNNLSFDIPDWVPEFGGKSFGFSIPELSKVSLPRLANGAVIRGGSPFAAILGDQPLGQTNVETPVSTIEDAVTRGMERYSGGRNMTINLNYDGETFARLSLNDILAEMDREGYDIDVLGGTV